MLKYESLIMFHCNIDIPIITKELYFITKFTNEFNGLDNTIYSIEIIQYQNKMKRNSLIKEKNRV